MGRKRKAQAISEGDTEFDVSRFSQRSATEDKVLIVEGKKMYVSKTVLQLASPVFNAMFESDFKEKHMEEIELKEKMYDEMVEFVTLLYPASRKRITMNNVFVVLPLADEYQVETIKAECEQCLLQALEKKKNIRRSSSVKFICHVQQQSSLYSVHKVEKACIDILCRKSQKEIESAEKTHPLPVKSKNKLLTKINLKLEDEIKKLESDTEMKDDIIDMKDYDNAELRRQFEKNQKELATLKQRLSDWECESRTQGIIKMEFVVSDLTSVGLLSEPMKFRGLNWRCKVSREVHLHPQPKEYLGFWGCFDPGYPNLENSAIACFKVINKDENRPDFICHMSESIFTTKNCSWGFGDRLKWEDFINPENGYVVDDMATIEMFVVVFKPRFTVD